MIDKIFVDSNVWIYLFLNEDSHKHDIAERFIAQSGKKNVLVISHQVINEVSSVSYKHKQDEARIRYIIEHMSKICMVQDYSKDIALLASDLRQRHSISFWDSLIVASAFTAQCKVLVSEDMQDGFAVGEMTIKNIFAD